MKLTFNGTVIDPDNNVFFNDMAMWYVRYNDSIVWQKNVKNDIPINLVASKGQPNSIFVNWDEPSAPPLYYNLYRDGGLYKSGVNETHFDDTGLNFGERHTYYATAVYPGPNGTEESEASNTDVGYTLVQAGSQTFTEDGVFTVPEGVTKLKICMIAGGNGGNASGYLWSWDGSGGKAGHLVEKEISVAPGQKFDVKVGSGGAGSTSWRGNGGYGGNTLFGNHIAKYNTDRSHKGDGQVTGESGCNQPCQADGKAYKKSYWYQRWRSGWGGQGSIFGKGGDAGWSGFFLNGYNSTPGQGYGAGGGSNYSFINWIWQRRSGRGAQGVCIVSWGGVLDLPISTSTESLSEVLGYDVTDPNFLNVRRYSTRFLNLSDIEEAGINTIENLKVDLSDFDVNTFHQVTPETYKGE